LLRHIALKIKNEGFELAEVASGIRFSNFIKQMGSSEEEMEKLLKDLEIYCFKTEQDFHDFVGTVDKINEFEMDLIFLFIKSLIILNKRDKSYINYTLTH